MITTAYENELLKLQNIKAQIADAEVVLKNLKTEIEGAKKAQLRLEEMVRSKSLSLDDDILSKHKETVFVLTNTENEKKTELTNLDKQITGKKNELEALVHNIEQSGESLNSFVVQIAKKEMLIRDLKETIQVLARKRADLDKKIHTARTQGGMAQSKLDKLNERIDIATNKWAVLSERNEVLKRENNDLGEQAKLLGSRERRLGQQQRKLVQEATKNGIINLLP